MTTEQYRADLANGLDPLDAEDAEAERAAVISLVQKLAKTIGKERPIIVAQACLMLIKLSTDLKDVQCRC